MPSIMASSLRWRMHSARTNYLFCFGDGCSPLLVPPFTTKPVVCLCCGLDSVPFYNSWYAPGGSVQLFCFRQGYALDESEVR